LSGNVGYCLPKSVSIGYLKGISGFNWDPEKRHFWTGQNEIRGKAEAKHGS
jgi:hypothetical protein